MSSYWFRSLGGQWDRRACVRHQTERLRGWRVTGGKTEERRKQLANIQENSFLFLFFCWWGRIWCRCVTHLHFFTKSCQRAWEPVWPKAGGTRTAGRGFSQATFSCDSHHTIKKYYRVRPSDLSRSLEMTFIVFPGPVFCFFFLFRFSSDIKVHLFGCSTMQKKHPFDTDFINLQRKTDSTIKVIDA